MPEASQWALFVVASVLLLVTPGPAVMYVVGVALDHGRWAGLASVAGIAVGTLGHVLATTLGLAALLNASPLAFGVIKWGGAAYLIWVGVRRMMTRDDDAPRGAIDRRSAAAIFRQGVIVNVLNPKTALFFLAFLPQFVRSGAPIAPQLLALGLTFTALGIASDAGYALLSGGVRRRFLTAGSRWWWRNRRYAIGAVFVLLGVTSAFTERLG
jgi:threonine/homoserine/homoserine lactone efflux protein